MDDVAVGSDVARVGSLRAGNGPAFEQLVRDYGGRLLAVAWRMLNSEDDACDAVQEAFITAFRSIDRFEGKSQLATRLHRIVVNVSLMKLRGQRRKREQPIEDLLPTFVADGHQANPGQRWKRLGPGITRTLGDPGSGSGLRRRASDPYRQVLLLRDIEELDTVAEMLSITPGAV